MALQRPSKRPSSTRLHDSKFSPLPPANLFLCLQVLENFAPTFALLSAHKKRQQQKKTLKTQQQLSGTIRELLLLRLRSPKRLNKDNWRWRQKCGDAADDAVLAVCSLPVAFIALQVLLLGPSALDSGSPTLFRIHVDAHHSGCNPEPAYAFSPGLAHLSGANLLCAPELIIEDWASRSTKFSRVEQLSR